MMTNMSVTASFVIPQNQTILQVNKQTITKKAVIRLQCCPSNSAWGRATVHICQCHM